MQYNFDQIVDRSGNRSAKYDERKKKFGTENVIPLWVADMDFKTAQPIIDALTARAQEMDKVTGLMTGADDYVTKPFSRRNGWTPDTGLMSFCLGVVQTLSAMVQLYTPQGGNVLIQTPVYGEFYDMTEFAGRTVIENQMVERDGKWTVDWEDFEAKLQIADLFLLCNPHNPLGIVWTESDLRRMMELCLKYRVWVVSDEIHGDFIRPGARMVPFWNAAPDARDWSILCTAPSKTFNLAALWTSNILIANDDMRKAFALVMDRNGAGNPNIFGIDACRAAYTFGDDWVDSLNAYIDSNFRFMKNYLLTELPQLQMIEPQGTYLAWVDCRALGMDASQLETFMKEKARLLLDEGVIFGQAGAGFERFNVACPRSVLKQALDQLRDAVRELDLQAD